MTPLLRCFGILALVALLALGRVAWADEEPQSEPTVAASETTDDDSKTSDDESKKADEKTDQAAKEKDKGKEPTPADAKAKEEPKPKKDEGKAKAEKSADAKAATPKPTPKPSEAEAKPAPEKPAEPKKAPKPPTYTVTREPFKVELALKGIFEATTATPVSLRTKQWRELTVVEAVANGSEVRKGEVLVQLEMEKIDDQIADLRRDLALSDLVLKQSEETLKILQESTPLELQQADRSKRRSDEDLERFLKVERPFYKRVVDFILKVNQQQLEYQKEELEQLEKMYKADDLTEQTEEIVLKRQRNQVEQAQFMLDMAKMRHEQQQKYELPRMDENQQYGHEQQDFLYRRTKFSLPVTLKQQQMELAKRKVERQRSQKRLEELLADREAMTIKAPADGTVYYGQYQRGVWQGAPSVADELRAGGSLQRDKIFMTIVEVRPMQVRIDVPEEALHDVRPGLKATVSPTGYPDLKLRATVDTVDGQPLGNQYAARLEVTLPHEADMLVPGMTCAVKMVPYLRRQALVVPAAAVFPDKLDDQKKYVYVYQEEGKPEKVTVTVGKRSGDRLEILEGLDRGDEILLEEPKDRKDPKAKDR